MKAEYLNAFTDYGFKKLFGEPASEPLLRDFLNSLLPANCLISSLSFQNPENLGPAKDDRRAVYDIYCQTDTGEKFIVELQKAKHNYFKDRTVYYSTFPIQQQAERGDWDYKLKAVFCVGILDFTFEPSSSGPPSEPGAEPSATRDVVHTVQLKDQHCRVFYDKLSFIYVEMPRFTKRESELVSRQDKWFYFLKHLEDLQGIPQIFKGDTLLEKALTTAKLANLSPAERSIYEANLKSYRDMKGVVETAHEEGEKLGLEKGEKLGLEKGEKLGLEKGERLGLEKALANLLASGMAEGDARRLLGLA